MINEKIIEALNAADDAFVAESMPGVCDVPAARTYRRSRRFRAVIIAASLVLVCGAVAFATGILTAPFSMYISKKDNTRMRIQTVDGVEVDFAEVDVWIPVISEKEITGPVRDDAAALLKEKQDKDEREWSLERSGEGQPWEKVYDDYYQVHGGKDFDSQAELLDYIGCKYFEPQYFPYDKVNAGVVYNATLKDDKITIGDCNYTMESVGEKIIVKTWTMCSFSAGKVKKGMVCGTGIGSFADDGSTTVELFTNPHGYNGAKGYANEGYSNKYEQYFISGCVVKNNCFYEINIYCDWADKAEADQIFQTWADNF